MKDMVKKTVHVLLGVALSAWGGAALAQQPSNGPAQASSAQTGGAPGADLRTLQNAQQQLTNTTVQVTPQSTTSVGNIDPSFRGSIVSGKATDGVLQLTLDDAIQRGLKANLGIILQGANEKSAGGQRLQQLQALLPTVTGAASIEVQQVNLAAYGLKFPGLNPIVGPFQVVDFRAYLTQNLVNINALESYLAARHNFEAARLTAEDARNLVVLTVGNAYLLCLADAARIDTVNAQIANSKVSVKQATDQHDAGTSPRLDVLRAQVDLQSEEQNLISTTNQLAKDKLALARAIGLPLDQQFALSDTVPYAQMDTPAAEAAFQQALTQRKDLAAAAEQARAGEAAHKAAVAEQYPTASFSGDFGDLGTTPAHSHGTYSATGTVSAPILQIAKTRGDILIADAQTDKAKAQYSDLAQQVNADVRDAILDIQTAQKLVDAAKSNVDLAHEAYNEAEERYRAGVSDEFEVSEALATSRQADDQYVSSLYQHNVAKLALARALGQAEVDYKTFLSGQPVPVMPGGTSPAALPSSPATTGPATTGPATTGPATTGPASTSGNSNTSSVNRTAQINGGK
jgi:outer membrane protein TolC